MNVYIVSPLTGEPGAVYRTREEAEQAIGSNPYLLITELTIIDKKAT